MEEGKEEEEEEEGKEKEEERKMKEEEEIEKEEIKEGGEGRGGKDEERLRQPYCAVHFTYLPFSTLMEISLSWTGPATRLGRCS